MLLYKGKEKLSHPQTLTICLVLLLSSFLKVVEIFASEPFAQIVASFCFRHIVIPSPVLQGSAATFELRLWWSELDMMFRLEVYHFLPIFCFILGLLLFTFPL